MKGYHFAALTALMGLAFVAGAIATALAHRAVENWYASHSRPQQVPPPPAFDWSWIGMYMLMGTAAWLVWLAGPQWGVPWVRLGMILYFVMLGVHVLWAGAFFHLDRPGAAFGAIVVLWVLTLATLIVFWQVDVLGGALLIPLLLWTGYLGLRNLKWWRHHRHLRDAEAEPSAPPTRLAA